MLSSFKIQILLTQKIIKMHTKQQKSRRHLSFGIILGGTDSSLIQQNGGQNIQSSLRGASFPRAAGGRRYDAVACRPQCPSAGADGCVRRAGAGFAASAGY